MQDAVKDGNRFRFHDPAAALENNEKVENKTRQFRIFAQFFAPKNDHGDKILTNGVECVSISYSIQEMPGEKSKEV